MISKFETPDKWDSCTDARDDPASGIYPNYWTHKTRSGHCLTMDDSKGGEHITMQHRGGSMIQFKPDGCVQFVSHNGQYNMVFGENRVKITGAYDITVDGGGSLRVEKDYNLTVGGNMNTKIEGDYNITSENYNATIRQNVTIAGKNITARAGENVNIDATGGSLSMAGKTDARLTTGGSLSLAGSKSTGLSSDIGMVFISGQTGVHTTALAGQVNSMGTLGVNISTPGILAMGSATLMSFLAGGAIMQSAGTFISALAGAAYTVSAGAMASIKGATVAIDGTPISTNMGLSPVAAPAPPALPALPIVAHVTTPAVPSSSIRGPR
ncbi:hypothetical protein EB001_10840 [bacterium]|nr:hypothetical protein [bacterium]